MVKSYMFMFVMVAAILTRDGNSSKMVVEAKEFSAMFVFGDSLLDCGNNVYFASAYDVIHLPFGIDFIGPTGRFCNGKTLADFLGDLVGLPLLPPFVQTRVGNASILEGVNYASGIGGILDGTGAHLGPRFTLRMQIQNFNITLGQLRSRMKENELQKYLENSFVFSNSGSNDYINNYLMPSKYNSSTIYSPDAYADLLVNEYANGLMELYNLGLRKFLLLAIGPLGCLPYLLVTENAPPGTCLEYINDMVKLFGRKLYSLVRQLNTNHKDAIFVFIDGYKALIDIRNSAASYGFNVTDKGCCMGTGNEILRCRPYSTPCLDRDRYIFWDAYHTSQAFNKIAAKETYRNGSSFCYPMSLQQMAHFEPKKK